MGLAPYGEPRFKDLILKHLMRLRMTARFGWTSYFNYAPG